MSYDFEVDKYGGVLLEVDEVGKDKGSWITIKSDSYSPNRQEYIMERYRRDHPGMDVKDFKQLMAVCGRSQYMEDWLSLISLEFSKFAEQPDYLRSLVSPKEYSSILSSIKEYNESLARESNKIEEISLKCREAIKEVKLEEQNKRDSITDNDTIFVLTLPSTKLPLSLQIAIENFIPGEEKDSPKRKAYAREILVNFQIALIKLKQKYPEIELSKVVEELKVK